MHMTRPFLAVLWCIAACASLALGQNKALDRPASEPPQVQSENKNQAQTQDLDEIIAVPNRPTFATTAEAVQRGVLEIEYGFEAASGHQNMNGLLKFGLFKKMELWMANNPLERDSGVTGITDSSAGFKYKVFSQKGPRPTFSVLYLASLPTATAGLGTGAVGHSVQLLVSKDFGKHHFDVNEGVQFVGRQNATGFDRNYFSALSYSHPITEKLGWTAEIAGFSRTNPATPATMTLLAGATYSVSSRLVLDGGGYVAAYGNLPRVTFFAGATYSIADFYRRHSSHVSKKTERLLTERAVGDRWSKVSPMWKPGLRERRESARFGFAVAARHAPRGELLNHNSRCRRMAGTRTGPRSRLYPGLLICCTPIEPDTPRQKCAV
jgi:hypothetical protein